MTTKDYAKLPTATCPYCIEDAHKRQRLIAEAPAMLAMLRDWPVMMGAAEWESWHAKRRVLLARLDGAA